MFDLYKMNNYTNQIDNNSNKPSDDTNINSITLSYFLNKNQYPDILERNKKDMDNELSRDKPFYRRRILQLTKNAFKSEIEDVHLRNHFNSYIKSCISHLKFTDKQDIIQDEYKNLNINSDNNNVCENGSTISVDNDKYIDCG